MVTRTYITKFNTIESDSDRNHGFAPVSELVYGHDGKVSRGLIYFDVKGIRDKIESGEMPDISKMRHTLKITNAANVNKIETIQCGISNYDGSKRLRAVSFDLIFFLIPREWDNGKGFAYADERLKNYYYPESPTLETIRMFSSEGSNWLQSRNGLPWDEDGIYSTESLSDAYDKYCSGEDSFVIAKQRFDVGNEDIEVDVTDVVNKFVSGELENHGIGFAFTPMTELMDKECEQFVGFFTNRTNTFFEPYVETRYEDGISDDRSNFVLGKKNRLYLYATMGTTLSKLDELPTVTIANADDEPLMDVDGRLLEGVVSEMYSKGVYFVEFTLPLDAVESETMIYDTWSNLKFGGVSLDDVELYTTVKPSTSFFVIGNSVQNDVMFSPSIGGINEREQIFRGDIRKLTIYPRPNYTENQTQLVDNMSIRIYVKDGLNEYNVIDWDRVEKTYLENYYVIDTNILIPNRYYVDIRIPYGMSSVVHHDVLQFDVVSDVQFARQIGK